MNELALTSEEGGRELEANEGEKLVLSRRAQWFRN
jgi:hypothetical protein